MKLLEFLAKEGLRYGLEPDNLAERLSDACALWAVRVLDAWAADRRRAVCWSCAISRFTAGEHVVHVDGGIRGESYHYGPTPDAARLAAAQAVYPTLPADVRAELWECP
jgi:hypothetical protein